jgi:hypothetical protein
MIKLLTPDQATTFSLTLNGPPHQNSSEILAISMQQQQLSLLMQ